MTDPGRFGGHLVPLSADLPLLLEQIQGLVIHADQLDLYPVSREDFAGAARTTLPVEERLARTLDADPSALTEPRQLAKRIPGTCRDYSLVLCAVLRERGRAARVRCGFATYFKPGLYEDHWICEYLDETEGHWRIADAQLDAIHRSHFGVEFDPADVPRACFLTANEAWTRIRSGADAAERFGHGEAGGIWFLAVSLLRDFLALGKQETSNWDDWRAYDPKAAIFTEERLMQYDALAATVAQSSAGGNCLGDIAAADDVLTPFWQHGPTQHNGSIPD